MTSVLAHGGAAASNLDVVAVLCAGVVVVFALAAAGVLRLETPGDLVLPLAVAALAAGLGGSLGDLAADQAPWLVPAAIVAVVAVGVAAATPIRLGPRAPLSYAATVVGVVLAVLASPTLDATWFPPPDPLPVRDDAEVELTVTEVTDGSATVEVAVRGGTIGGASAPGGQPDPEEGLRPRFLVGDRVVTPALPATCGDGCDRAILDVEVGDASRLVVELVTDDLVPLAPPITDAVSLDGD